VSIPDSVGIDKLSFRTYDTGHMSQKVEVKSNLFPACQNCQAAKNIGEDAINRVLTPDVCYTPPSKRSAFVAIVTCAFDTGVEVEGSKIVYEADVTVNGESKGGGTGPVEVCPGMYLHSQIPA